MTEPLNNAEIIALEKSYWDAMKAKDGRRTAELAGQTSLVTGARGVATIAKDKMGAMTEEGSWVLHDYDFEKVEVSAPAPNVAIIAYEVRQDVTMDGKRAELRAADSSTWIKGANGWECHAHSETFLGDKPRPEGS
jgi:hypothetical protein